ncbi:MAG: hypothetical protein JWM53_2799 [bacterium]|nr:hypothetical protein [bacterium]
MFAIAGIVFLLVQAYLRPQELLVPLQPLPLTALFFALTLFGLALDLKLRRSQLAAAPQLVWALALAGWLCLQPEARRPLVSFALFFTIAHGVQSFRALATVAVALLGIALAVAVAAVAHGPMLSASAPADPEEVALLLAAAVPLAVALGARRRAAGRSFTLLLALGLAGVCVFVTQSRAGYLALAAVPAVYCAARFGVRSLIVAALVVAPLWLLGGSGVADPSAQRQRLHDLAAADGGWPGLLLGSAILYVSFKVVAVVLRSYAEAADAAVARGWALALLASLAALTVGSCFVSFGDHFVFWIHVGLVGALYQAARAHDPKLAVRFDGRDLFRLAAVDAVVAALLWACASFGHA